MTLCPSKHQSNLFLLCYGKLNRFFVEKVPLLADDALPSLPRRHLSPPPKKRFQTFVLDGFKEYTWQH